MELISNVFLSVFVVSLISFSFVVHPVLCCLFLLAGSLSLCGYIFLLVGFSWYILLFCLVYVGGVFILFIYVSMFNPNAFLGMGLGLCLAGLVIVLSNFFFWSPGLSLNCFTDYSGYLCGLSGGHSYCVFCLVLLLGFGLVSFISSSRDSFFR